MDSVSNGKNRQAGIEKHVLIPLLSLIFSAQTSQSLDVTSLSVKESMLLDDLCSSTSEPLWYFTYNEQRKLHP